MNRLRYFIFTTIVLFLFWLAYTSSFKTEEVLTGLIVSTFIALFTYGLFAENSSNNIIKRFLYLIIYLPVFLWEMIKANLDVAKRVLSPSLPINPGIVAIKTNIGSDTGKMFLANSITLTPGTLTLDIDNDNLYIHWIDVKSDNNNKQQDLIAGKFEKLLGGIF